MDYDIFCGMDVDKKSVSVTFASHRQILSTFKVPSEPRNIINYARKQFANQRIAFVYEAGPTGYGMHDELEAANFRCLVTPPSMIPRRPGQRVKTNRVDSKKLTEELRGGNLHGIHVPSKKCRDLRHLSQFRDREVSITAGTKNKIKSLLLFEGIPFPGEGSWTQQTLQDLRELPCRRAVRFKIDKLLESIVFHKSRILAGIREIRQHCRQDEELRKCIEYLMSLPGIGWITASHALGRIGDWRQLENVKGICGFLGLGPREKSTGEKVWRGSITKTGDPRLRSKLIESAWRAIRIDPELKEVYARVYKANHKNIAAKVAIVAVARKLATRIYAVLKEQRPYKLRLPVAVCAD